MQIDPALIFNAFLRAAYLEGGSDRHPKLFLSLREIMIFVRNNQNH